MDSAPLTLPAEPLSAMTTVAPPGEQTSAADASGDAFSQALEREMTRGPDGMVPPGKSQAVRGTPDATEEGEAPSRTPPVDDADSTSLIAALALPASPATAAPPIAAAASAAAVRAAEPIGRPVTAGQTIVDKPAGRDGATAPSPAGVTPFPDVSQPLPKEASGAMQPPLAGVATREAALAGRECLSSGANEAHTPQLHAEPIANTTIFMPAQTPAPDAISVASPAGRVETAVAPAVGTSEWGAALAHKVTWMVNEHHQMAQLQLNPPDLGPLEIRLTMSGDDNATATAQFASPHAPVREALEAAMPRLREMLAENGILLGNATIADSALPRDQRDQSGTQSHAGSSGTPAHETAPNTNAARVATARRMHGLVDIFA